MVQYEGACQCGQTQWTAEIPSDKESHVLCHCGVCQKMSGGPFTLNQIVPKDAFKLTKGNLNVYTYKGDSGNSVDCYMCPNCGSNPYHHQHIMGDDIVVRTGLLKGSDKWGQPALEIFGKQKLSWQPQTGKDIIPGAP